jgi:glucokinase
MKICADAGGTSIRIAYVDDDHKITMKKKYLIDSFPGNDVGFYSAINKYLSDTKGVVPLNSIETIVVSAAGHIKNERVQFTNADWLLSTTELSEYFRSTMSPSLRALLLNDFEALSYGLSTLENEDVETIFRRKGHGDTKMVCGPGTGLGLAALKQTDDRLIVIPSEGGHQSFPPETATEREFIKDSQQAWASYEHILSGQGLQRLFSFFSRKTDGPYSYEHSPEEILRLYEAGNSAAIKALEAFSYALGTFCGNMALALGATNGVYLWGGILTSFPNHLLRNQMMYRFHQRGRAASYVANIPVYKICCEELPLRGCSIYESIKKNYR